MIATRVCILLAAAVTFIGASDAQKMPPLSRYLMAPNAEIALARSAAPASISQHATIMVLTSTGYSIAVKGQNGFTCLVERAFAEPDMGMFGNVRIQDPTCYNAPASRSVLAYTLKRASMAIGGATGVQIEQAIQKDIASKALPVAPPDSIAYMMSKDQYIDDASRNWFPHLMFFMPHADGANLGLIWGADRMRSPIAYDPRVVTHEPWARFFVPVSHWSDGSSAPPYTGT